MPVPFAINDTGYPAIANGSDVEAVLASFRSWETVPSADVRFDYRGKTSAHVAAHDGINMISFTDNMTALPSSVIAVTLSYFKSQGRQLTFDESDIIFSTTFDFSTSGETNKFDIQSVLTHEIGHFLGLDHSAMVSSVMVPFGKLGQLDQRTLQYDDVAAISEIYPKALGTPAVGEIQGSVLSGGLPIFGANVVAVDQTGTAWVATLSQRSGSFDLRFLPPGLYKIFAEPLDQPVSEQNLSTSWYHNLNVNFGTTYYGNVSDFTQAQAVQVDEGAITSGVDIQVLPKGTSGLNLTRPSFGVRIPRNFFGLMTVGGIDVTAGIQFSTSTSDMVLGAPTYGGTISSAAPSSASMSISVAGSATPGPKNITVMRGTDSSIVAGGIVIVDVQPRLLEIFPVTGPNAGGTHVTISGANFRPGAQVSFAGLSASEVNVVDAGTIIAITPANVPGVANVLVVNADGTNGVISRGFTYLPPAPAITSLTPSSGAAATVVTISGTGFDPHTSSLAVQFNGNAARVSGATSTSITAIVPYGATSGPVTVNVFGVTATGDATFTVIESVSSANQALDTYNFVDSSSSNGGSTLNFQGRNALDDGLATVPLPFTFSLFNDIYLAGSLITVSTNGWISLESSTNTYAYQNGPLPGTSATDAGGTVRSIPPSLIAPFYDDLVLIPNVSSISTKVAGTAPNRQLIVEFTRLSILDEDGRDQNASITFEIVLFEGSNDIQFVYQNVAGPRSDASNATIGLQNLARDTAVLTSFNEPKVRSGLFLTYKFNNGTYSASEGTLTTNTAAVSIIPYAPQSASEFSGIAMFAPSAMSVVLTAFDSNGNLISGGGVQNPMTLVFSAGQQYTRLVREIFGLSSFSGWIQVEASAAGLGVYTTTGASDMSEMDGTVAREKMTDFVLSHPGGQAILVNPSLRTANLTITDMGGTKSRTMTIAPLSKILIPLDVVSRIQSSESLAAVERFGITPKLGMASPLPPSSAQNSLVIPGGVTGGGYTTTLSLVNLSATPADATISFAGSSRTVHLDANSSTRMPLLPVTAVQNDAVRIVSSQALLAVAEIESPVAVVSLPARPAATDVWFPHVAQGNGLFTGLAIAAGAKPANVTVEVYPAMGGSPQSSGFTLAANQQISKVVNEIVPSVTTQSGGYIHIHSDQPLWTWEIFGSATILASVPPMVGSPGTELEFAL